MNKLIWPSLLSISVNIYIVYKLNPYVWYIGICKLGIKKYIPQGKKPYSLPMSKNLKRF